MAARDDDTPRAREDDTTRAGSGDCEDHLPGDARHVDPFASLTSAVEQALVGLGGLANDQALGAYLQQVLDLAARVLPDVAGLSVTLLEHGQVRTAAFTTTTAALLDERQYELDDGPCVHAAAHGVTVHLDLTHPPVTPDAPGARTSPSAPEPAPEPARERVHRRGPAAHPRFAEAARHHGVRGVTSIPMVPTGGIGGALNIYSTEGPVRPDVLDVAATLVTYASTAVGNAARYQAAAVEVDQLRAAMVSRAVIEQAKGVLMAQHALDPDAAFAHLTQISQSTNVKLRDVATAVVDRATRGF